MKFILELEKEKPMKNKVNCHDWVTFALFMIGGIHCGLLGFFNFNLVSTIFHTMPLMERLIYGLAGIAAIYTGVYTLRKLYDAKKFLQF